MVCLIVSVCWVSVFQKNSFWKDCRISCAMMNCFSYHVEKIISHHRFHYLFCIYISLSVYSIIHSFLKNPIKFSGSYLQPHNKRTPATNHLISISADANLIIIVTIKHSYTYLEAFQNRSNIRSPTNKRLSTNAPD